MRDPDLVQRAERASIVLEQAWERWRAMHGLGAEPLPPVSSYVGYSLEEPWGQPRVVFGLRADEAELLAAQLEGHECAGPLYVEVSARADWRRTANGPASLPRSPYSDPFSVPAQARGPRADLIGPESVAEYADGPRTERALRESAVADSPAARRQAASWASSEDGNLADADEPDGVDDADWPGTVSESVGQSEVRSAPASVASSPPLSPLPPVIDFRPRPDQSPAELLEPEESSAPLPGTSRAAMPSQGPGYRGPRYRGFPPRYESGSARAPDAFEAAPVAEDDASDEAEPAHRRPQHVAKLGRPPRKRTRSVRAADRADAADEPSAAEQAR